MNQKYKKLWIKALRSGEYKQGTGALCKVVDKDGKLLASRGVEIKGGTKLYCCLGVLHDIINKNINSDKIIAGGWLKDELLTISELSWSQQCILSNINDRDKKTFEEIANYIEKEL